MKENKPWWKSVRLPTADRDYYHHWAKSGLIRQALEGGSTVCNRFFRASLKEGDTIESFFQRFQEAFLNLRTIEEQPGECRGGQWTWELIDDCSGASLTFDGDRKVSINVITTSAELLANLKAFWAENATKSLPKGRVHVLVTTDQGPSFTSLGSGGEPLIRDNYNDKVLAGYDRIVEDMNSEQPRGRLAILNGSPGTGKTFIVRGLLNDIKNAVKVVVPANLVVQLAQPGMVPALVDLHRDNGKRPIIFLIEDADEVLAARMGDNMSAVSVMLNLGDGILGQLLDIRIIATTNAKHQDLDEAIMRPGRLSAHVSVDALPYDRALKVFRRLVEGELDLPKNREYTLAEIYQMAFDKGWKPPKEAKKLGFVAASLEESDDDGDFQIFQ